MKNLELKQQLYNQCLEFIDNRLKTIQKTITEIQKSLHSETKSSAGDKHETGRAMLQLELEKTSKQLVEVQKLQEVIRKIDITSANKFIGLGSVVFTSKENYFIAVSAGKLYLENNTFYAISSVTPIAKLLLGKQHGDIITFRNDTFAITKIA